MVKLLRDRSFRSTWRLSKCNSLAFWKTKGTFSCSQHTSKVFLGPPEKDGHVIDFHKFHWNDFVKIEMVTRSFCPLSCSFVKEAVFYCICLVQWSRELNSDLLNSDDDTMEKFILPNAIRFPVWRNWVTNGKLLKGTKCHERNRWLSISTDHWNSAIK